MWDLVSLLLLLSIPLAVPTFLLLELLDYLWEALEAFTQKVRFMKDYASYLFLGIGAFWGLGAYAELYS